jgi:ankyrin repeat protein
LIETHGADVNAQGDNNDTPLHHALRNFNPNYGGEITVLTYLLTQKGINVNIKGHNGKTLLHTASQRINKLPLDVFKTLIETHGADVNAQDNRKDTPLHCALRHFKQDNCSDITVFAYLINQKNINVNIKNEKGCTLLHLACTSNLSVSRGSVKQKAEIDTTLSQIVETIVKKCIEQVLDERTF